MPSEYIVGITLPHLLHSALQFEVKFSILQILTQNRMRIGRVISLQRAHEGSICLKLWQNPKVSIRFNLSVIISGDSASYLLGMVVLITLEVVP